MAGLSDRLIIATENLNDGARRIAKLQTDEYKEFLTEKEHKELVKLNKGIAEGLKAILGLGEKALEIMHAMNQRR